MFSETRRQIVHMAMGGFALLLRTLTWWQAALMALAALLFNAFLLPRLGGRALYRRAEVARGLPVGILAYPLSVLLLILVFPRRLDIVAAAWGIMAVGDGAATLVGRRFGGPRLPWNRDKTLAGTMAFILFGAAAGILLAWWTRPAVSPPPPLLFVVGGPIAGTILAALVETIPVRLDDNIAVPAVAATVLWGLSLVTRDAWTAARPAIASALVAAVALNAFVAAAGWRAAAVSASGAIGGAFIGVAIYACAGWSGWLLLFAAFASALASSRAGFRRKALLGIAEARGGRRGMGNAVANCGVAAFAAVLAAVTPYAEAARLAMVAALAAGGGDTVASEIGKAWGRHTVLVTSFARVPPGTPGAVSIEGTAAGLVSALALAAVGVAGGLIPASFIWPVVAGATVGSFVESALGATLEAPGILNNDLLNFINTAVAAICTLALAGLTS